MAMKKKRVAKKKVAMRRAAKKKVVAVDRKAEMIAKLRQDLKEAKEEKRGLAKKVRESERQVKALLKLLEKTQEDANKFLTHRVKNAVAKYGVVVAPKRRRRVAKKKARVRKR